MVDQWGSQVLPQGSTPSLFNWSPLGFCPAELESAQPQLLWHWFATSLAVRSQAGYWPKWGWDTRTDALQYRCCLPGWRLRRAAKNHYSALASEPGNQNGKLSSTFYKTVCGCPQLLQWAGMYPSYYQTKWMLSCSIFLCNKTAWSNTWFSRGLLYSGTCWLREC